MGRRGRKIPPLDARTVVRILEADGWRRVPGGKHLNFEHDTKPNKVQVSESWRDLTPRSQTWRNVFYNQAGLTEAELDYLYWEVVR